MTTLTQRYVHAAVAGVPEPARDDVAEELSASVADAVDALVAHGVTPERAEVQALTELGDPAILAERFGGRPRHLIGPAYFGPYVQLLRILLMVVVPIVGVTSLLAQGMAGQAPVPGFLSAVGTMFAVGVQICFWVTVVFVVLERTNTPVPSDEWTPDELPEIVDRRITGGDTAAGMAALVLLIWAIVWQRSHWLITVEGQEVPALNPGVWTPWVVTLLGILVASLALEVMKYHRGHWTVSLAIVNTALNAAFAGIVVWLYSAGTLLSPGVAELVPVPGLDVLMWIVVLIAVVDTVSGWWAVLRAREY